jgi:hypothetical protein
MMFNGAGRKIDSTEGKMDIYSKVIFTVIAVALCILAIEDAGSRARAANGVARVAICNPTGERCVDVDAGGSPDGGGRLRVTLVRR